jgi:transposase InsO family protein
MSPFANTKKTVHFFYENVSIKGVTVMAQSYLDLAARANLRLLHEHHPLWTRPQLAVALGMSEGWVKKWLKRFREEQAAGIPWERTIQGQSRARKTPPPKTDQFLVEEILSIRDQPRDGLRRVPGPEAISYFLHKDPLLALLQLSVPSCKTIYRILKANDRIAPTSTRFHEPMERPDPMTYWQIDFKDVSSVPADPDGKKQHVVETLNIIDRGTSILLDAHVRPDFTAETALLALTDTLKKYGRPQHITLDRDTRWVGSPAGSDFPAALIRFAMCLEIEIEVCAPRHPEQNGFVERYNRTYQEECLAQDRPEDLEHARTVTEAFVEHYNYERPHQGISCGNRPPRTAFPQLALLPPLPETIDPDRWLKEFDGQHIVRKVDRHGMVSLDLKRYYVSAKHVGQRVALHLDASERCMHVMLENTVIKDIPLRGLVGEHHTFEQFLNHMQHQARAQTRLRSLQERKYRTEPLSSPKKRGR